tara:strand:- start:459 stop:959 length:501 start_codon:yes stop_codon:yes gene_type:complete
MATALFITRDDLVRNTFLSGNVDTDKFIQFIKIAQEVHIQQYLGTKLFDKISADIIAGSLSGTYQTLVNEYVQPMLIHYAMTEYLPFSAFTASNGGLFKKTSENGETATRDDISFLIEKERNLAEYYTRRFIDFMAFNQSSYPEYTSNTNDDIHPLKDSVFQGWVL